MKSFIPQFPKFRAIQMAMIAALLALGSIGITHAQIYVAFGNSGVVGTYSTSGSSVNSSFISIDHPYGINLNSGSLYVGTLTSGQSTSAAVNRFNATTGVAISAPLQSYGAPVIDLALYGGNVYTAYFGNNNVGEYSATVPQSVVSHGIISGGLGSPRGVAFDAGGTLYVSSYSGGTVGTYTSTGTPINASLITGVTNPWGIAVDAAGNIYVGSDVSGSGGSVGKYDIATHQFNASFITGLNRPLYLTLDGQGDLFVSMFGDTSSNGSIGKFDTTTGLGNAQFITSLNGPTGIAIDPTVIPEPSSVALISIGVLAFASWKTRRTLRNN
ncbi:MAG: PEP-CTERM sorting domain-containing protein [Chthoniobacterales bacterium]